MIPKTINRIWDYPRHRELKEFVSDKLGVNPRRRMMEGGQFQGLYWNKYDCIWVKKGMTPNLYLHVYLHECVHAHCHHYGIFPLYHNDIEYWEDFTPELAKKYVGISCRAERWVDKKADKLAKEFNPYFPSGKFILSVEDTRATVVEFIHHQLKSRGLL